MVVGVQTNATLGKVKRDAHVMQSDRLRGCGCHLYTWKVLFSLVKTKINIMELEYVEPALLMHCIKRICSPLFAFFTIDAVFFFISSAFLRCSCYQNWYFVEAAVLLLQSCVCLFVCLHTIVFHALLAQIAL